MRYVKACLLPANTNKKRRQAQDSFDPLLGTEVSGSPIIRDGKLVGAVTQEVIGGPADGCGIYINNILNAMG